EERLAIGLGIAAPLIGALTAVTGELPVEAVADQVADADAMLRRAARHAGVDFTAARGAQAARVAAAPAAPAATTGLPTQRAGAVPPARHRRQPVRPRRADRHPQRGTRPRRLRPRPAGRPGKGNPPPAERHHGGDRRLRPGRPGLRLSPAPARLLKRDLRG